MNEAIGKIEGKSQCSGEAEYVNDIPSFPGELTAFFVLATIGNCDLDTVDASAALVRSFFCNVDLPKWEVIFLITIFDL